MIGRPCVKTGIIQLQVICGNAQGVPKQQNQKCRLIQDGIQPAVLKPLATVVSGPVHSVCRASMIQGGLTLGREAAAVVAIQKGGDKM